MSRFVLPILWMAAAGCLLGAHLPAQDGAQGELEALQSAVEESKLGYKEKAEHFRPQFEALAGKHAGTDVGLEARLWLLQQTWWQREDGTMNEAAGKITGEILTEYSQSKLLGRIAEYGYVLSSDQKTSVFGQLISESPHAAVRAAGHFGLGKLGYRSRDAEKKAAARKHLEILLEDYAAVPHKYSTYGELAPAYLHPHDPADLAVGKMAPEIVGRTHDGKPLKLSDFRGKVVVLDFWGDW